ncbi:MAG: formate dehydrogenase [Betaproteobacteria bacterium]|nr:formate dehydrogenase [Betaproteobacteria bacterium]
MKKSKFALVLALTVAMSGAWAKLPAPSEEAQAKAAEAKVKAAENAKMESELLGKTQDRVAQKYIADQKAKGVIVKPTPIAPPAPPAAVPPVPTAGAAVPAPAAPVAAPAPAPAAKK